MTTSRPVSYGITVPAAAALLALSPKTVYAACADGRIKADKRGGHWSVDALSLNALLLTNSRTISGRKSISLGSRLGAKANCRIRAMKYGG